MRILPLLCLPFCLTACQEPGPPSRAVLELYVAADGVTKCVDADGPALKADARCCPPGFSVAGFATPSATAYYTPDEGTKKYQYRHVVCLQDLPPTPPTE